MKHGYRVLTTGKIYHDSYPPKESRGDGTEFGVWGFHGTQGPYLKKKLVNTESPSKLLDWGVFPGREEETDDQKVADWAIEQLTARGEPEVSAINRFSCVSAFAARISRSTALAA